MSGHRSYSAGAVDGIRPRPVPTARVNIDPATRAGPGKPTGYTTAVIGAKDHAAVISMCGRIVPNARHLNIVRRIPYNL